MNKMLLLNLPFDRPVQRDYGCPHGVKAAYYWPPIDLLMFGAIARQSSELSYIDSIAKKYSRRHLLDEIGHMRPDAIFTILSSITLDSDLAMLRAIKDELPDVKVWASGDVIFFGNERFADIDFYVHDLTNKRAVLDLLSSDAQSAVVPRNAAKEFSIGLCPHDLTRQYHYVMPYSLYRGVTSVITNYGCPFACTFCNSNKLSFKRRAVEEVIEELRFIHQLGVREVFFRDFNFPLSDVDQLCDAMIRERIPLKWSCFCSATHADPGMLKKMKAAGCYLIIYGAESGDDAVLARVRKHGDTETLKSAVLMTRAAGIEILTSFIIGFPGEDRQKTVSFISDVDPDYLSLNILSSRLGSRMSEETSRVAGANTDSLITADKDIREFRDAVEKKFFMRPAKLVRYAVLSLKTPYRFIILISNAVALVKRWFHAAETIS